jgi:hypothetical protein
MKQILALAFISLFIASSCTKKTTDHNHQTKDTVQAINKDSIGATEQEHKDAPHGHTH